VTKLLAVEPEKALSQDVIRFSTIPVNAYQKSVKEEQSRYSTEEFLDIWRICAPSGNSRPSSTRSRLKGAYRGVAYNHAGPPTSPSVRRRPPWAWPSR
jgi:2-oxoisovalerate dehydrogenase E1 component